MKLTKENRESIKVILKDYNMLKAQIKCIDIELKYEEDNQRIERLKDIKTYKESLITNIERAYREMNQQEQQVLKLRYLDRNPKMWREIGTILGYSSDYCRKELFNKCLVKLYNNIKHIS
ncbi:DNA-binding protein [Clostridium sardiniense]|uniref:DNA-binding protein n=1 Tax=Clostridium sardiniense TaxID=29369 RepID=UPI001958C50B|nr:DNA-binding protein [Clostridium sardiniense]MBM7834998.1 DNA-directed RNA polymerase specialized sigma subunit [Clostridium sardiniense]